MACLKRKPQLEPLSASHPCFKAFKQLSGQIPVVPTLDACQPGLICRHKVVFNKTSVLICFASLILNFRFFQRRQQLLAPQFTVGDFITVHTPVRRNTLSKLQVRLEFTTELPLHRNTHFRSSFYGPKLSGVSVVDPPSPFRKP